MARRTIWGQNCIHLLSGELEVPGISCMIEERRVSTMPTVVTQYDFGGDGRSRKMLCLATSLSASDFNNLAGCDSQLICDSTPLCCTRLSSLYHRLFAFSVRDGVSGSKTWPSGNNSFQCLQTQASSAAPDRIRQVLLGPQPRFPSSTSHPPLATLVTSTCVRTSL